MSHFYGTLKGATTVTKPGTQKSGLTSVAASYKGAIEVTLYVDIAGNDCYRVDQIPWQGAGVSRNIAVGVLGT